MVVNLCEKPGYAYMNDVDNTFRGIIHAVMTTSNSRTLFSIRNQRNELSRNMLKMTVKTVNITLFEFGHNFLTKDSK